MEYTMPTTTAKWSNRILMSNFPAYPSTQEVREPKRIKNPITISHLESTTASWCWNNRQQLNCIQEILKMFFFFFFLLLSSTSSRNRNFFHFNRFFFYVFLYDNTFQGFQHLQWLIFFLYEVLKVWHYFNVNFSE